LCGGTRPYLARQDRSGVAPRGAASFVTNGVSAAEERLHSCAADSNPASAASHRT
jgi:hypothetical protein